MINSRFIAAGKLLILAVLLSCSVDETTYLDQSSALIDPNTGGSLQAANAKLLVPPQNPSGAGNITEATIFTVSELDQKPTIPAQYVQRSNLFRFDPAGAVFDPAAEVALPFSGEVADTRVLWTTADGTGWETLSSRVEGSTIIASVKHFSDGMVVQLVADPAQNVACDGSPDSCPNPATDTCFPTGFCGVRAACGSGLYECVLEDSSVCLGLQTDVNCGGCGNRCTNGTTCVDFQCVTGAPGVSDGGLSSSNDANVDPNDGDDASVDGSVFDGGVSDAGSFDANVDGSVDDASLDAGTP